MLGLSAYLVVIPLFIIGLAAAAIGVIGLIRAEKTGGRVASLVIINIGITIGINPIVIALLTA